MRSFFLIGMVLAMIAGVVAVVYRSSPESNNASSDTEAMGSMRMPNEIEQAQIEDKAGVSLPLDIEMIDQDGRKVRLEDYFKEDDRRPVILTLGYYGCPMLCSLVLNGLVEGLKNVSFKLGKDYRILSMSIDDREQPDLAKKKQLGYLDSLTVSDVHAWNFHVMTALEAKRLAEAVGFNYVYDKKNDQFAHGAGFFVISPTGILSRTLFGITYKPSDIKLALGEAADGKIGSFVDRVILSCFHYDPDSHRYGIYIFGVMRLGGVLTIIIVGMVLLMYFRSERKQINL